MKKLALLFSIGYLGYVWYNKLYKPTLHNSDLNNDFGILNRFGFSRPSASTSVPNYNINSSGADRLAFDKVLNRKMLEDQQQ